jgi:hypothetical protein
LTNQKIINNILNINLKMGAQGFDRVKIRFLASHGEAGHVKSLKKLNGKNNVVSLNDFRAKRTATSVAIAA